MIDILNSSLVNTGGEDSIIKLMDVDTEVLDEFVCWLYSPRRSFQLVGLDNLRLLLDVYQFACAYSISDLKINCYHAMAKHHDIIGDLERLFDNGTQPQRALISDALTGGLRFNISLSMEITPDVTRQIIVNIYMFGLKLSHPLLRNMMMDYLQDIMLAEDSVFSLEEVEDIFSRTSAIACQDQPLIKFFCVALIRYQLTDDRCPAYHRLTDDMVQQYLQIPGVSKWYDSLENDFLQCRATEDPEECWDPRNNDLWEDCMWHTHALDDECHRQDSDDEAEDAPTEANESVTPSLADRITGPRQEMVCTIGSHLEDIYSAMEDDSFACPTPVHRSESPEPSKSPNWHAQLVPHKVSVQLAKAKEDAKEKEKAKELKKADLQARVARSGKNNKRKADGESEDEDDDDEIGRGQRRKVSREY